MRFIPEFPPSELRVQGPIAAGMRGPKGDKGDKGDIGPTGPQGAPGAAAGFSQVEVLNFRPPIGQTRENFFAEASISGPDTEKVLTLSFEWPTLTEGPQGPAGAAGSTGPQGPEGAAGEDGQSAFAAAQEGGYTDTQGAFYADLAALQSLASELEALL